jgi:hypothetical protein
LKKQEILDRWFKGKWAASSWAANARNLWRAADVLFVAFQQSVAENGEPINCEDTELDNPATLLYGYAIENAIKGLLIKRLKLNESACEKLRGWRQHDLAQLFDQTNTQIGNERHKKEFRLLLVTLTAHILWAGKYPSTFQLRHGDKGFLMHRQWQPENASPIEGLPPLAVNILSRERLKDLFTLLNNQIWQGSQVKSSQPIVNARPNGVVL